MEHEHLESTEEPPLPLAGQRVHRRVHVRDLRPGHRPRPGVRPAGPRPAPARRARRLYGEPACLFKDKLIYKPPGVKGYGLHQDWIALGRASRELPDRARAVRPGRPRQRLHRGLSRLPPRRAADASRTASTTSCRPGPVDEAKAVHAGAGAGRRGGLRRVHPAPIGPERVRPLAAATLPELQRALRRRRPARRSTTASSTPGCEKKYAEHGKSETYFE